ncbi:MAG: hypothetical protein Kow00123_11170 [Anaerolineales bacterium]
MRVGVHGIGGGPAGSARQGHACETVAGVIGFTAEAQRTQRAKAHRRDAENAEREKLGEISAVSVASAVGRDSLDNSFIESQELGECTWTG